MEEEASRYAPFLYALRGVTFPCCARAQIAAMPPEKARLGRPCARRFQECWRASQQGRGPSGRNPFLHAALMLE